MNMEERIKIITNTHKTQHEYLQLNLGIGEDY